MDNAGEQHRIALLKQQDAAAFKQLVEDYGTMVFNTAIGLLQHRQDAEDVSQEVFEEVFQSIQQFKGDAKLSTWIYRITITKSLEMIRSRNRKKRFGFMQS